MNLNFVQTLIFYIFSHLLTTIKHAYNAITLGLNIFNFRTSFHLLQALTSRSLDLDLDEMCSTRLMLTRAMYVCMYAVFHNPSVTADFLPSHPFWYLRNPPQNDLIQLYDRI
jgi:hypothetical protein